MRRRLPCCSLIALIVLTFVIALHTSNRATRYAARRYWKFHHMWRSHMQTLVSMVGCLTFFSSKTIARPDHVCNVLVSGRALHYLTHRTSCISNYTHQGNTLALEVEDYLIGLCDMSNELVRAALVA